MSSPTDNKVNLVDENDTLKKSNESFKQTNNGLVIQLDAHKQMINDLLQSNLTLRTHSLAYQQEMQNLNNQINEMKSKH